MDLRSVVVFSEPGQAGPTLEGPARKDCAGVVESDPQEVLGVCTVYPPDLLIAKERERGNSTIIQ